MADASARTFAGYVKSLKFATDLPEREEDAGSGLEVKLTIVLSLVTPEEVEVLAHMQSEGQVKLTMIQQQLAMGFGKGGDAKE